MIFANVTVSAASAAMSASSAVISNSNSNGLTPIGKLLIGLVIMGLIALLPILGRNKK